MDDTPFIDFGDRVDFQDGQIVNMETGEVQEMALHRAINNLLTERETPIKEKSDPIKEAILAAAENSALDIKLNDGILRLRDTPRAELIPAIKIAVNYAWDLKGGVPPEKEQFRDSIVSNLIPWLLSKPERSALKVPEILRAIRESISDKEWFGGVSFTNITKAIQDYIFGEGAKAVEVARDVRDGKCRPGEISPERWQLMGRMWLENKRLEAQFEASIDQQAARARLHEAIYGKPTYESAFGKDSPEKRVQDLQDRILANSKVF